jgi:hypothetical protein
VARCVLSISTQQRYKLSPDGQKLPRVAPEAGGGNA